ncbi:J domain-containing protein [Rhodoplanes serenus]|uniref:J domain-containing protein n=1 Tax=Rhodoplanes serenus TaxID=200615 RepID=UPI000DAD5FFA|nr:J domain-containing protein [Rhodoplanes serenus]RAI32056.1 molecular chaperone DnaJ [Rhodoplanes serenus]
MKFDSPLFDRIRVKPERDRRPVTGPACEWPGCAAAGTHRAPKGRTQARQYWRFCLDHVRDYNQNYDFFAGMPDSAVAEFQKDALTGHRPTWKLGLGTHPRARRFRTDGVFDAGPGDPFDVLREFGTGARPDAAQAQAEQERRTVRNAERKALATLGLDPGVSRTEIKNRFKELVKRHHPDANGGDRASEDKLREILEAYNYLKSTGLC